MPATFLETDDESDVEDPGGKLAHLLRCQLEWGR